MVMAITLGKFKKGVLFTHAFLFSYKCLFLECCYLAIARNSVATKVHRHRNDDEAVDYLWRVLANRIILIITVIRVTLRVYE